jgi:Protein of unknown function (DUF3311)
MTSTTGRARRGWYLLFLVQFVAVLWPPFYNRADPRLLGMPFFYWYQLLWVIGGAACTAIVYRATRTDDLPGGDVPADQVRGD